MTPEEFEQLDPVAKAAAIDKNNEEVRQWWMRCQKCGRVLHGTLKELRARICDGGCDAAAG